LCLGQLRYTSFKNSSFSEGHAVTHFGDNAEMTDRHNRTLAKVIVGMTISLDGRVRQHLSHHTRTDLVALDKSEGAGFATLRI
jgi:hypothetical protein